MPGHAPFCVFVGWIEKVIVVASPAWERGKPVSGFPLFHPGRSRAVGMWESRGVGEISKGRWGEWETCFGFSTLSMGPPFPRPLASVRNCAGGWVIRTCTGATAWPLP